jgi:hypothetical protein
VKIIDPDASAAEHAHIADPVERVRQVNSTLAAMDSLREKLVEMRREDLIELVYQGRPVAVRGALSAVAERVGMTKSRVSQVIHPPAKSAPATT